MACYTAYLVLGHTLHFRSIRANAIVKYFTAVSVFSIPLGIQNSTHDQFGKRAPCIDQVLKQARRWESMPNFREPLTSEMLNIHTKQR